tara:strand:+ start:109 stop:360 length:252 start_codon:yes stop_codon:yes gene_type:complete
MTKRLKTACVVLVLAGTGGGLAGCGQKGDLFLPGENPNPPTSLLEDDADRPLAAPVEAKTTNEPAGIGTPDDRPADAVSENDN